MLPRYPTVKIAIIFTLGILLQRWFSVPLWAFAAICISFSFVVYLTVPKLNPLYQQLILSFSLFIVILLCGNITAAIHYNSYSFIPDGIYKQDSLTAYGKAENISLPDRNGFDFYLNCNRFEIKGSHIYKPAKIIVKVKRENTGSRFIQLYELIKPGNYIAVKGFYVKGREERNPGEFDYNRFLRNSGISGIVNLQDIGDIKVLNKSVNPVEEFFRVLRFNISAKINALHDFQTASLLRGLLLADRSDIDEDVNTNFINAGVVHVLAVSGLHVGFIVMIFLLIFGRFNLKIRAVFISAGIIFYILLTGAPPSVIRAGIMSLVFLFSFLSNRDNNLLNSIAISAVIILVFNPSDLYHAGFQLSFAAVLSIALIYPVFLRSEFLKKIKSTRVKNFLLFILLSLSAQLGTLPLAVLYFGKISLTSLAANLIVIPLSGLILANGIFTVVLSYIVLSAAIFPANTSAFMVKALYGCTAFFGGNGSFLPVSGFSLAGMLLFYFYLGLLFYWFPKFTSAKSKIVLVILIAVNLFLSFQFRSNNILIPGNLSVLAVDVGQGDCFLIRFPNGKNGIVDAGECTRKFDNGERVLFPLMNYLGTNVIDYAFISHMDKDHFSGILSLLKMHKIKHVYKPAPISGDSVSVLFDGFCKSVGASLTYYSKMKLSIGNTNIYILNDKKFSNPNDNSGILKMVYGNISILFTGDESKSGEKYYTKYKSFLGSTILKVAHHGSRGSSSDVFLNEVKPKFAVISAGIKNRYGHPSLEVLQRLKIYNSVILRTDQSGAVILNSDGETVNIAKWK